MTKFSASLLAATAVLALPSLSAGAQSYAHSVLYTFCQQDNAKGVCTDGGYPSGLVMGQDGLLYVTASGYQIDDEIAPGAIITVSPSGTANVLYTFSGGPDGRQPQAPLIQAADGNFYGTASEGGDALASVNELGSGTLFRPSPSGAFTLLHTFCSVSACTDGGGPVGSLLQASDGNFYGATVQGGSGPVAFGAGTLFQLTPSGTYTVLHTFCTVSGCPDGEQPNGSLVQGSDGALYGTTFLGGAGGEDTGGTVFRITTAGEFTTLYSFCNSSRVCPAGYEPTGGLTVGANGELYGTTSSDGNYGDAFEITTGGSLKVLHLFDSGIEGEDFDGETPTGTLLLATDKTFYGTTYSTHTLFRMSSSGTVTTIYDFAAADQPTIPAPGLIEGPSNILYGVSPANFGDGANPVGPSYGKVYKLTGMVGTVENPSSSFTVSPYPPSAGDTIVLDATVTGAQSTPTGTVTFTSDTTSLCHATLSGGKGSCSFSAASFPAAVYTVAAYYSGNVAYNSLTTHIKGSLAPAPTKTLLSANPTSVTVPASVTLSATVSRSNANASGTPTGTVSFLYGDDTLATEDLNASGTATYQSSTAGLTAGTYGLTARYNGDANNDSSVSAVTKVNLN